MTDAMHENAPPRATGGIRWRWYHFYFLLALFDLIVIGTTLVLHHRTLASYEHTLHQLVTLHAKHRWAISLRLAAMDLNAPGNDIFASRDVETERLRFRQTQVRLGLLMRRDAEFAEDLSEFRRHIEQMVGDEAKIFDLLENDRPAEMKDSHTRDMLEQASVTMASMDRHQAAAVTSLSELEQMFLMRRATLLHGYGKQLERAASVEKYLLGTIVLILIGVFWYGRMLQRMHERMATDHYRAITERRERLASVGEVCSSVAHGIRNPLAAISSSAQLVISHGTLDEASARRVRDVLTECQRLNRRVTRLLDFSAMPDRGSRACDLKRVLGQAIEEVRPVLEERGLHVATAIDGAALTVHGDRDRLAQSIIELLSNAMDHLGRGGHIQISCRRSPTRRDQAEIDIVDDGPGLSKHIRDRVFDLFFTTKPTGTGIGLASVKRTIEYYGGDVAVEPSEGKGAHFRIRLPLS